MTGTENEDARTIQLTERQRERLDEIEAECANDHMPEPTDEEMVNSLLDTWDAVGEGHYSEQPDAPDDDGIWFCPLCGSRVEPRFAFMSAGSHAAVVDCPEHGTIDVEYAEDSHRA